MTEKQPKLIGKIDITLRLLQLVVSTAALALGLSSYIIGNSALLLLSILVVAVVVLLSAVDWEKSTWYRRVNALERLKLQVEFSQPPLKETLKKLYRSGLEMNYQYALLERRTELARRFKEKLDPL